MIAFKTEECEQHYAKVVVWAMREGFLPDLVERLHYLNTYACEQDIKETRCWLYPDFEAHSFSFEMEKRGEETGEYTYWFNGGLIFDSQRGAWSVHT